MRGALVFALFVTSGVFGQGSTDVTQELSFDITTNYKGPIESAGDAQGSLRLRCNPCKLAGNFSLAAAGPSLGGVRRQLPAVWDATPANFTNFDFTKDWLGLGFRNTTVSFDVEVSCIPTSDGRCEGTHALLVSQGDGTELSWAPGLRIAPSVSFYVNVDSSVPVNFTVSVNASPSFGALAIPLDSSRQPKLAGLHTDGLGVIFPRLLTGPTEMEAIVSLRSGLRWKFSRSSSSGAHVVEMPRSEFTASKRGPPGALCLNGSPPDSTKITLSHFIDRIDLMRDSTTPLDVVFNNTFGTHCQSSATNSNNTNVDTGRDNGAASLVEPGVFWLFILLWFSAVCHL